MDELRFSDQRRYWMCWYLSCARSCCGSLVVSGPDRRLSYSLLAQTTTVSGPKLDTSRVECLLATRGGRLYGEGAAVMVVHLTMNGGLRWVNVGAVLAQHWPSVSPLNLCISHTLLPSYIIIQNRRNRVVHENKSRAQIPEYMLIIYRYSICNTFLRWYLLSISVIFIICEVNIFKMNFSRSDSRVQIWLFFIWYKTVFMFIFIDV